MMDTKRNISDSSSSKSQVRSRSNTRHPEILYPNIPAEPGTAQHKRYSASQTYDVLAPFTCMASIGSRSNSMYPPFLGPKGQLHDSIRDNQEEGRIGKKWDTPVTAKMGHTGARPFSLSSAVELSPRCGIPANRLPPPPALGPPSGLFPAIVEKRRSGSREIGGRLGSVIRRVFLSLTGFFGRRRLVNV